MPQAVYARCILCWEADVPLTDELRAALLSAAQKTIAPVGQAEACFDAEGDALCIRLEHTRFPAPIQRQMGLWLCAQSLGETATVAMGQAGTLYVGQEFSPEEDWQAHQQPMKEISDWWAGVSPMEGQEARRHRTQLQTIVKRRQYNNLGGYVSRALRAAQEPGLLCFAFVPLVIEAIWSQHAELSLSSLCEGLNLADMARRPKDALMAWLGVLPGVLRRSPSAATAAPIDRVIAGIRADCSLPYSQQNLSRSLGLTPAYFCRLFYEKTGQHFSTFLTVTRMEKAQALLADGQEHNLAQVSLACGYPNKSYFCQVFKKYTGMTPSEFEQRSR